MSCKRARPGAGSVPTATVLGWALCLEPTSHHAGLSANKKRPPLPRSVSALMCPANGPLPWRAGCVPTATVLGWALPRTLPTSHHAGLLLTGPLCILSGAMEECLFWGYTSGYDLMCYILGNRLDIPQINPPDTRNVGYNLESTWRLLLSRL